MIKHNKSNPFYFSLNVAFSLLVTASLISLFSNQTNPGRQPKPTELLPQQDQSAKKEFRNQRKLFIDQMHRAAPNDQWKSIELHNRLSRHNQFKSGNPKQTHSEIEILPGVLNAKWMELGSNNLAGRMLFAEIDYFDSTLYAASQGGNIWFKKISASNWEVMNDHFQIDHILYLKSYRKENLHRIFAVNTSPWVYYSDDFGLTWSTSNGFSVPQSWGNFRKALLTNEPAPVFYVLAKEWDYTLWTQSLSIYQSKDEGVSFQSIHSASLASESSDLWSHPRLNSSVYFLQQNDLYRIENDSLTFVSSLNTGSIPEEVYLTGYFDGSSTHLFAGFYRNGETRFYHSLDAGLSWIQSGSLATSTFMSNSFYASQLSNGKVFFGGVECFQSNDYGLNWTKINSWGDYYSNPMNKLHADIPAIQSFVSPSGQETYYISTDGGTYSASNPLSGVTNISMDGLRVSQYYSVYSNRNEPENIYAGSQDQGFQKSLPSAGLFVDFEQTISGDYGHLVSGDQGSSIWTVYPSFLMYYPQINQNLDASFFTFQGNNYLWMPPLCEHPYRSDKVYIGGGGLNGGAHLFEFTYGNGISQFEHPFDFSSGVSNVKVSAIAYSVLNPQYRYVATNDGQFYYSSDEGSNWTKTAAFSGPDGHYFYGSDILTTAKSESLVYLAGSGYSNPPVYRSTNYGQTFQPMRTGLPSTLVFGLAANEDGSLLFAATESGPYIFVDSLNRWFDLSQAAAPDQVYWSVEYIESLKAVRFGTHGRGIWQCSILELLSAITPKEIADIQIYPNPCTDYLQINLRHNSQRFELIVYDSQGKRILHKSAQEGRNTQLDVSSLIGGMYWLSIKSENQNQLKKFLKD